MLEALETGDARAPLRGARRPPHADRLPGRRCATARAPSTSTTWCAASPTSWCAATRTCSATRRARDVRRGAASSGRRSSGARRRPAPRRRERRTRRRRALWPACRSRCRRCPARHQVSRQGGASRLRLAGRAGLPRQGVARSCGEIDRGDRERRPRRDRARDRRSSVRRREPGAQARARRRSCAARVHAALRRSLRVHRGPAAGAGSRAGRVDARGDGRAVEPGEGREDLGLNSQRLWKRVSNSLWVEAEVTRMFLRCRWFAQKRVRKVTHEVNPTGRL